MWYFSVQGVRIIAFTMPHSLSCVSSNSKVLQTPAQDKSHASLRRPIMGWAQRAHLSMHTSVNVVILYMVTFKDTVRNSVLWKVVDIWAQGQSNYIYTSMLLKHCVDWPGVFMARSEPPCLFPVYRQTLDGWRTMADLDKTCVRLESRLQLWNKSVWE